MKPQSRIHPQIVVREPSPNVSARTEPIKLVVLHSTESHPTPDSSSDLAGVASWFKNPASQVSCHVIVDDDGHSARCVNDEAKAWHVYLFNSFCLGIEQVGFASQGKWVEDELHETARWIAHWSRKHKIPIQKAEVTQGPGVTKPGVTTHNWLGPKGGGHTDPGAAYPFDAVLELARAYKELQQKET